MRRGFTETIFLLATWPGPAHLAPDVSTGFFLRYLGNHLRRQSHMKAFLARCLQRNRQICEWFCMIYLIYFILCILTRQEASPRPRPAANCLLNKCIALHAIQLIYVKTTSTVLISHVFSFHPYSKAQRDPLLKKLKPSPPRISRIPQAPFTTAMLPKLVLAVVKDDWRSRAWKRVCCGQPGSTAFNRRRPLQPLRINTFIHAFKQQQQRNTVWWVHSDHVLLLGNSWLNLMESPLIYLIQGSNVRSNLLHTVQPIKLTLTAREALRHLTQCFAATNKSHRFIHCTAARWMSAVPLR